MNYLILIIVALVSFAIGRKTAKTFSPKSADELDDIRAEAHEALSERTENRKEKILEMMNIEAVHQKELKSCDVIDHKTGITCSDVEKLLDVSSQTAVKYLNELRKRRKD